MQIENEYKFNHRRFKSGREAFENNDLLGAFQLYVQENNIEGLFELAIVFAEEGKEKEAQDVFNEANRLNAIKNGVRP